MIKAMMMFAITTTKHIILIYLAYGIICSYSTAQLQGNVRARV